MININDNYGTVSGGNKNKQVSYLGLGLEPQAWDCAWFPTVTAAPLLFIQSVDSSETSLRSNAGGSGSHPESLPHREGVILAVV